MEMRIEVTLWTALSNLFVSTANVLVCFGDLCKQKFGLAPLYKTSRDSLPSASFHCYGAQHPTTALR